MRRRLLALLCLLTGIGLLALGINSHNQLTFRAADGLIPGVTARTAASFTDSVGINIHAYYTPIPWANYVTALNDLHIHYVRDTLAFGYDDYVNHGGYGSNWIEKIQELKAHGVSTLAISNELTTPSADTVNYIKLSQGAITAIDGPNEVDYQCYPGGTTFTGQIWQQCPDDVWRPRTEAYVTSLWNVIKADRATSSVEINSPSIIPEDYHGSNVFANTSDFGNIHFYPYLIGNVTKTIGQYVADAAPVYPGKPLRLTEIGYPSQLIQSTNRPASPELQAAITPIYLMEAYQKGIKRTYLYELVDDHNSDDYFGLISDTTGERKPAFTALQNLMNIFQDSAGNFTPGQISYQLGGDTSGVSSLTFQKSTGDFIVLLWQSALAASPTPLPGQSIPSKPVSLTFGDNIAHANVYQPSSGASPIMSADNPTSLASLSVGENPLAITITPSSGSGSSGGDGSSGGSGQNGNQSTNTNTGGGSTNPGKSNNSSSHSQGSKSGANNDSSTTVNNPDNAPTSDGTFLLPDSPGSNHKQTWWQHVIGFFNAVGIWVVRLFIGP